MRLAARAGMPHSQPQMITIPTVVLVCATPAALPGFLLAVASILTSG